MISARRSGKPGTDWLWRMLERKPVKVVAVALANRMARVVWAIIRTGDSYRARTACIGEEERHPDDVVGDTEHCLGQADRNCLAQKNKRVEQRHADRRGNQKAEGGEPHDLPDADGDDDGAPDRDHRRREVDEKPCDDSCEGCVHHQKDEEHDEHEHPARVRAEKILAQRADRPAPVAYARPERAEIMNAGEEDGARRRGTPGPNPR